MPRSVRARLTATIAVLAALLSVGAVWFGSRAVESNLIDEALRERAEIYIVPDTGEFLPTGWMEAMPDAFFAEALPFEFTAVEMMLGPGGPALVDEILMEGLVRDGVTGEVAVAPPDGIAVQELPGFGGFLDGPFVTPDSKAVLDNLLVDLGRGFAELDSVGALEEIERALGPRSEGPIDVLADFGVIRYDLASRSGEVVAVFDDAFADPFVAVEGDTISGAVPEIPDDSDVVVPLSELSDLSDALFVGTRGRAGGLRALDEPVVAYYETTTSDSVTFGVFAEVGERVASADQIRRSLWIAAGLLTVLAAAATWVLTGRALHPVDELTRRVGAITTSTLGDRVPVPETRDEIHELATTMNSMLDRIEVGDQKRRRFVADASHELRTPVAILRSEAEIARRVPDQIDVTHLADAVLAETDRLGTLVEDLLVLARTDELLDREPLPGAGGLPTTDLDEVVFEDATRTRRVDFNLQQVSGGRVRGARDELARVVGHLFDNAARHAVSQVAVGVTTDADRGVVVLTVDDDGKGIAPGDRSRIFDRFVRLDDARTRDAGGAGLGLAVVKTMVRHLGGEVTVGDSPLGGARLLVELPAAVP